MSKITNDGLTLPAVAQDALLLHPRDNSGRQRARETCMGNFPRACRGKQRKMPRVRGLAGRE